MDKFAKYDYFEELEIKILKSIIGYMLLEKVDTIEMRHILCLLVK